MVEPIIPCSSPHRDLLSRVCSASKGLVNLAALGGLLLAEELNLQSYSLTRDAIHCGRGEAYVESVFSPQSRYARALSTPGKVLAQYVHHTGDAHAFEPSKKPQMWVTYDPTGTFLKSDILVRGTPELR